MRYKRQAQGLSPYFTVILRAKWIKRRESRGLQSQINRKKELSQWGDEAREVTFNGELSVKRADRKNGTWEGGG